MNDTSPAMEAKYRELMALKTPYERMEMAGSMYETSCQLIRALLPPGLNAAQIKLAIWERMHGHDPRCVWARPHFEKEARQAEALCPTTSSASTVPSAP